MAGERQEAPRRAKPGADGLLVAAFAAGATADEAATAAGVSRRTAQRRMAEPTFRQEVQHARAEMVGRAVGKLTDASTAAVDTLRALLGAEGESARLGAARSILELGTKLREGLELEERVAAL